MFEHPKICLEEIEPTSEANLKSGGGLIWWWGGEKMRGVRSVQPRMKEERLTDECGYQEEELGRLFGLGCQKTL